MTAAFSRLSEQLASTGGLSILEALLLDIFDETPLEVQPHFLVHWGNCDKDLLQTICTVVARKSLRGRHLLDVPLTVVTFQNATHLERLALPRGIVEQRLPADCQDPKELVEKLQAREIDAQRALLIVAVGAEADNSALLEAWAPIADRNGLIVLGQHPVGPAADHLLLAAAAHGLLPREGCYHRFQEAPSLGWLTVGYFERRDYCVRAARATDLSALRALELNCWPRGLRMSLKTLRKRLTNFSSGQMVLEQAGQVLGVVYSHRITSIAALAGTTAETVDILHQADGLVLQLLALNIHPEMQHRRLGDQLLEFMLQRCAVMKGVNQVIGVTRCKDHGKHPDVAHADYISLRNEHGRLVDTVLRFHELHGAKIQGLVTGYRPNDQLNGGHGVLVVYDLQERERSEVDVGSSVHPKADATSVQVMVTAAIQSLLGKNAEEFLPNRPLMEMGLDSADLLELTEKIAHTFGLKLPATFFFEHNTGEHVIAALHNRLNTGQTLQERNVQVAEPETSGNQPSGVRLPSEKKASTESFARDIAIVGMACRLPGGVNDADSLWRLMSDDGSAIGKLPDGRWRWPLDIDPSREHVGIDYGGFLDDIAGFDAGFFRISPREAELMDPQQRLLLELSWACLENAGYAPGSQRGSRTGVYIGASGSDYQLLLNERIMQIEAHHGLATSMAVLANRLSYFHDFTGPSIQVDTACSSSLVALNEAVQSLRSNLCDQALVGGVHLMCHPTNSITYYKAGMLAPDGRCKTFDAAANGYVRSEGAIMLLLKPVVCAERDGDIIHGIIKGVATNHGGQAGGLTVPHPGRQAELLVAAYADARIDAASVSYIEAHGTGTALGDPIEVEGLKRAFGELTHTNKVDCGLGSVKTNLGHLEAVAGLAGLLKVLLSMRHRRLPASLHFERLNPRIDLTNTRFHIVTAPQEWAVPEGMPLRAGISSFGSGGSNVHIVVEAYPEDEAALPSLVNRPVAPAASGAHGRSAERPAVIVLSARNAERLGEQVRRLLAAIESQGLGDHDLVDLAYTLQVGREAMEVRLGLTAASIEELKAKLQQYVAGAAHIEELYLGEVKRNKEALSVFAADDELQEAIGKWVAKGKFGRLLDLWVKGLAFDWSRLYGEVRPRRLSLPTYPFARERYWVPAPLASTSRQGGEDTGVLEEASAEARSSISAPHLGVLQRQAVPLPEADALLQFEEVWAEEALAEGLGAAAQVLVCLLSDLEQQHRLIEALARFAPDTRVVFATPGSGLSGGFARDRSSSTARWMGF